MYPGRLEMRQYRHTVAYTYSPFTHNQTAKGHIWYGVFSIRGAGCVVRCALYACATLALHERSV